MGLGEATHKLLPNPPSLPPLRPQDTSGPEFLSLFISSSMAILNLPRSLQNNAFVRDPLGVSGVIASGQSRHPSFAHLVLLVFEAVLEVVCVSLPGYFAAQQGMFDAEAQKLVANLNVTLFTPCLSTDPPPRN